MDAAPDTQEPSVPTSSEAAIAHLRTSLDAGRGWPSALLEAMALWTSPEETFGGRHFNYFIGGEAFDWLLLAERLLMAADDLVPQVEREELLFSGRFPPTLDPPSFEDLLGVDKYRGHLNHYYGVTVEEALQLAVELEVLKRHASNGVRYRQDFAEEAFVKIYRAPHSELMKTFRDQAGLPSKRSISLAESKEFTYWLFRYRVEMSDKAKVASDTNKGLEQLRSMREASRTPVMAPAG